MTIALIILAAIALAATACIVWDAVSIRLDRAYAQGHADAMDNMHAAGIQAGFDAGWHGGSAA